MEVAKRMVMTLNRHKGVRAGLAWNKDVAGLIRQHNDANILVMPGRFVGQQNGRENHGRVL